MEGSLSFAALGDGPYTPSEERRFERLLEEVRSSEVDFVLHVGDVLRAPCSDEMLRDRQSDLDALPFPVVYTPGDNEWTDCHRARAGEFDPLERLDRVREIFFPEPGRTLGRRPMAVRSQSSHPSQPEHAEFVENVRWRERDVVFATVHVVGSGNGGERFSARTEIHDEAFLRRRSAAIDWLGVVFDEARRTDAAAVVVAFHGNPGLEDRRQTGGAPYLAILDALEEGVVAFGGPVLVVHGDTHNYRVDRPFVTEEGDPVETLTRLEVHGSPTIGWTRVTVVPGSGTTFRFEPHKIRRRPFG